MKIKIFMLFSFLLMLSYENSVESKERLIVAEMREENTFPKYLYKIISKEAWEGSLLQNEVVNSSMDNDFIHLATFEQLPHIVQKFWDGKDCVILKLTSQMLNGNLVHEANPGGHSLYYHLYEGSIPLEAVADVSVVSAINN